MDNELKIDLAKTFAWTIIEPFKEYGEEELHHVIKCLREYRTEIEKELAARDKSYSRIDEDNFIRTLDKRILEVQRNCPDILANTVEGKFDDPKEIKEL